MEKEQKQNLSKSVRRVEEYVFAHINERITVREIARELKLNASYLNSSFKRQTGECISSFIQKSKVRKAQEMLKMCQYTITDIWTALGYFDQSHFNKHFKKFTGITPRQYRLKINSSA
ncbi:MAG: helix-turn-helix transcriptional regulator [Clostridiales bacterium]|nr:helix-turn-helix transcriptional regulator [Clostridiales bacterium]